MEMGTEEMNRGDEVPIFKKSAAPSPWGAELRFLKQS